MQGVFLEVSRALNWIKDLELTRLLSTTMVSVDETWDYSDPMSFLMADVMILLFVSSAVGYCADIYCLVKRKNLTETMIGMLLPIMAALSGALWLTENDHLPSGELLERLVEQPFSLALSVQLTACSLLFAAAFLATLLCWRKTRQENSGGKNSLRWIASYCLELLTAAVSFGLGCYGIFANIVLHRAKNPFAGCSFLYGIFLYMLPLMLFKIVLLFLLILLRVYGMEITLFPYTQEKNAGRYLYRWMVLYHSPLLREVTAFFLVPGFFLSKAAGRVVEEDARMALLTFAGLAAGYLWVAFRRSTAAWKKFDRWGNGEALRERFCREYFCEAPLFSNGDYTVTRSFLVEEKNAAGIYYFGALRYLPQGWRVVGKKWVREIGFTDGSSFVIEKGQPVDEEIFRCIDWYAKSYGIGAGSAMKGSAAAIKTSQPDWKGFSDFMKGPWMAFVTVVMLFLLTLVLFDGLGLF